MRFLWILLLLSGCGSAPYPSLDFADGKVGRCPEEKPHMEGSLMPFFNHYPFWLMCKYDGPFYKYGYPAWGTSEPDVVYQFTMSESSGSIVDTVGAYTLAATANPQYGQLAISAFRDLSPGIGFVGTDLFNVNGDDAGKQLGTSDGTIEGWVRSDSDLPSISRRFLFGSLKSDLSGGGWYVTFDWYGGAFYLNFWVRLASGLTDSAYVFCRQNLLPQGELHHLRVVILRPELEAHFYLDNIDITTLPSFVGGSASLAFVGASSIAHKGLMIGGLVGFPNFTSKSTIFEHRLSLNRTNNSFLRYE
jgi:hypothetical protein